jgi:hypothetical protein
VAKTLLPDLLHYKPGSPASYPANGRSLTDDVMDVFIPMLTNARCQVMASGRIKIISPSSRT